MSNTQKDPGATLHSCGWAPGNYWETCDDCHEKHIAAKRSRRCRPCAEKEVERRRAAELQPADEEDTLAKIMADRIGHGMREKCVPHARAVIEAGYTRNAEARIQGLLEANNAEVERRRAVERLAQEAGVRDGNAIERLRAALRPFADLGVGSGPDEAAETYRIERGVIRGARAVLAEKDGAGSRT